MTDIPHRLLGCFPGEVALATLFLPQDRKRMRVALKVFETTVRFYGLKVAGCRDIPIDTSVLGDEARRTHLSMTHSLIRRPAYCRTDACFERVL